MSTAIEVQGVSKRYGDNLAVNDISFAVPTGSLCGFLGPNGAGKSTTIRMIMSIIYPDAGTILARGGSALDSKDRIGYLPEERGVYRKMRVAEFLGYIARLKGIDARSSRRLAEDWLERMELPGVARKRCQELSKGMQQKVQFIATIMHDPELIILDEPFSGLDPVNANLLGRVINELNEEGRTIIFSTHVLHQAERICDRVLMINQGSIVLDDTMDGLRRTFDPSTILLRSAEPVKKLIAESESLPGVVEITHPHDDEHTAEILLTRTEGRMDRIPPDLIARLSELTALESLELRRPTLDDVFVSLVGTSISEAEDAKA